jgi:Uma2 family endonuclease
MMSGTSVRQRMTPAEFLRWEERQDRRYELVGGMPRMLLGAQRRHDRIVVNLVTDLGNRLRGTRCQPFTAGTAVLIPGGNVRRPDGGVDCGVFDDTAMHAAMPVLVIEVLAPSTKALDARERLEEYEDYKTLPSLETILLVDPDQPEVTVWERKPVGVWHERSVAGLAAEVAVATPGITMRLADIYQGLAWR